MKSKDTPSQMPWDDEDHTTPGKFSSWDLPTPESSRRNDDSEWNSSRRSSSSKRHRYYEKETPLPTPTYKKNSWNRKSSSNSSRKVQETASTRLPEGQNEEDWEAEQKRLDREWYGLDEGYDEAHNPFSGISAEYTRKKEEQMEAKKVKRLTQLLRVPWSRILRIPQPTVLLEQLVYQYQKLRV